MDDCNFNCCPCHCVTLYPEPRVIRYQNGTGEVGPTGATGPTGPTGPAGTVTSGAAVADVAGTPTLESVGTTLNALLASLRAAGIIKSDHEVEIDFE